MAGMGKPDSSSGQHQAGGTRRRLAGIFVGTALALSLAFPAGAVADKEKPPNGQAQTAGQQAQRQNQPTQGPSQNRQNVDPDVRDSNPSQHPSGKDRNVESGGSYPQGNSRSNPDGGGVDKPYAADGQPAQSQGQADFDGNNGCGNDNDFDDDNPGNCGGRNRDRVGSGGQPGPTRTPGPTDTPGPTQTPRPTDDVAGERDEHEKVNVCHATGSDSNPFVLITVDRHSVQFQGHLRHAEEGNPPGGRKDIIGAASMDQCVEVAGVATPGPTRTPRPTDDVAGERDEHEKVNVCHATGSDSNPFVFITVDRHSVQFQGHLRHAEEGNPPGGRKDIIGAASMEGCVEVAGVATAGPTHTPVPPTNTPVPPTSTPEVAGVQTSVTAGGGGDVTAGEAGEDVEVAGVQAVGQAEVPVVGPEDVGGGDVTAGEAGEDVEVAGVQAVGQAEIRVVGPEDVGVGAVPPAELVVPEQVEVAGIQITGLPLTGEPRALPILLLLALAGVGAYLRARFR